MQKQPKYFDVFSQKAFTDSNLELFRRDPKVLALEVIEARKLLN